MKLALALTFTLALPAVAEKPVAWPPVLPGGKPSITLTGPALLEPTTDLRAGVTVAKDPPTVTFLYYDCQTYEGKPWSVWGDGLAVDGHYYSAVGDHMSPGGNAFLIPTPGLPIVPEEIRGNEVHLRGVPRAPDEEPAGA